jgi:hypothetical protein
MKIQHLSPEEPNRLRAIRLRALRGAPAAFSATFEESAARPPEVWVRQLAELATFVAVEGDVDVGVVRAGPEDGHAESAQLLSL